MTDRLVTTVLKIKDCGHDEYWLQDMIYDDPSILGLGDLQAVMKEKTQSAGGRLDLLLKDTSDDSMYEVEVQLGDTDPSHIIRTIEYWDNEKRRWPNRSHTAVLVAEAITSRFFNVVHLLSKAIPIIGIQANIVQIGDARALHFTKVIDTYEETEEEEAIQGNYGEKHWLDKYPGTLNCAHWYRDMLTRFYGDVPTRYGTLMVTLYVGGLVRVAVRPRKGDRALISVAKYEGDFAEAVDHLTSQGIPVIPKNNKLLTFTVDLQQLKEKQAAHERIAQRLAPQHLATPES
jgi:hypothetical protein